MKLSPNPPQMFLLLSMLFGATSEEREPMQSKTGVDKKFRDELIRAGVIRLEKRRRGRSTAHHLVLDDTAWDFINNHLGSELSPTPRAAKVLAAVLARLKDFMHTHDASLAEFVTGSTSHESGVQHVAAAESAFPQVEPRQGLDAQIRNACLALTNGETRKRVRLKDLRATVPLARDELDQMLLAMQVQGRLVLYKMDNPAEISAEDEQAALLIAGQPRHLVYLEA